MHLNDTRSTRPLPALPPHLEALTARGFHIFPAHHPISQDVCSCPLGPKCGDVGKHPCITGWEPNASRHPNRIASWLKKFLSCNWGVACGPSGVIVLDEDSLGEFEKLWANLGYPVPATYTVRTAKGHHFYFSQTHLPALFRNSNSLRNAGYKIDVRGVGGYVIAAGSVHRAGVIYEEVAP